MKTIYYTASSLDGFIADADNSLSWLFTHNIDSSGTMGYERFIGDVGALVMGSTTYQWLLDNDSGAWGYDIPCWVLTHRDFPARDGADIRFTDADLATVHRDMVAAAGGRNVWIVGGGDLAGQFADRGLLDEIWVQYAPVTLGGGAPLLPRRLDLRYEELVQNGEFACARLSVVR